LFFFNGIENVLLSVAKKFAALDELLLEKSFRQAIDEMLMNLFDAFSGNFQTPKVITIPEKAEIFNVTIPALTEMQSQTCDVVEDIDGWLLWRPSSEPSTASAVSTMGKDAVALYEHVEGIRTVRRAIIDSGLSYTDKVKKLVKEMIYRNFFVKADEFALSYCVTDSIRDILITNDVSVQLRQRLLDACFISGSNWQNACALFAEFKPGITAQDLINRSCFKQHNVHEPKLFLAFMLEHGWLIPMPDVKFVHDSICKAEAFSLNSLISYSFLQDPHSHERHCV
jgi:hypothetical protein